MAGTQRRTAGLGTRFALCLLAGILIIAATASVASAQDESQPATVEPEIQDIGLLFNQTSTSGSLRPLEGKGSDRFVLTLKSPGRQVIWFQDRPGRGSGQIPIRSFARSWAGFGFKDDPPNAALTLLDAANDQDTVVLKLGEPRYRAKTNTIRYSARILDEATGNLSHLEPQRDRRVPRRFGDASLFIDDATGPVLNGCVIQPYTPCEQLDQENATGVVTIFNPTGTGYEITVNGATKFPIPAATPNSNWMPATGANPIPRNEQGNAVDGQFGWDNAITISPTSGGGSLALASIAIPHQLQMTDDLELYLFYSGDPSASTWILLSEGRVFGSGGMTAG